MVQHFVEKGHKPEGFKFVVLEIVTIVADKGSDVLKLLAQQEMFWIFRLRTLHPHGLNIHLDYTVY